MRTGVFCGGNLDAFLKSEYNLIVCSDEISYRLAAIQTAKYQLKYTFPDGNGYVQETSSKGISKYTYDEVKIEIPEEARKLLSSKTRVLPVPHGQPNKADDT